MSDFTAPPDSSSLPESIRLLQLVWKLKAALDRASIDMQTALGVSGLQRFLLRFVGLAPGITADGLSDAIGTEPQRVQSELDQLVAANLLIEHRDTHGYFLTAKGVGINAAMTGTVEEAISKTCDDASPYERTSFRRALELLVHHLGEAHPRSRDSG